MSDEYLTEHFKASELWCRCGKPDCQAPPPADPLLEWLERFRYLVNAPVILTSGSRCQFHNEVVNGYYNSPHLRGTAADIAVTREQYRTWLYYALWVGFQGVGIAPDRGFLHVDVDSVLKRPWIWTY